MLTSTRAHPAEAGSAPPESTRKPLLVDRSEAARLLSLSERTIFTLTKSGQLPSKRIGRNVRYSVDELVAWLSKTTNATTSSVLPSSSQFRNSPVFSKTAGLGDIPNER